MYVARTGQEALSLFPQRRYDLVLLDIQLPDMTGFDIAQRLRQEQAALPPLVALTANVIKDKTEYLNQGMDDAISKPISVTAMTEVIERLAMSSPASVQPEPKKTTKKAGKDIRETLLDLEMLTSYVDIVGAEPVFQSIAMFEELMPEYLKILDSNMTAKDQDGIASEAHKIKGAAGSIGLKHIQKIAQKAQSPELPAWWENIADWVDEMKEGYVHDLGVLKQWLEEYTQQS